MNFHAAFFSLFLCALLPGFAFGQTVTVSSDLPIRNDEIFQILGRYDGRIMLYLDKMGEVQVEVYDQDLRHVRSVPLQLEKKNVRVAGVSSAENEFSILYSYRDKGVYFLKAKKFDADIKLIDTLSIDVYQKPILGPRYFFDLSEDKSKALIFRTDKDRELEAFCVDLWSYQTLWQHTFTFKKNLREVFRSALITNLGDLYIIGESSRNKIGIDLFTLDLVRYSASSGEITDKEFLISDLINMNFTIHYDNLNHQLICAGIYAEKNPNFSSGTYILKINPFELGKYQMNLYAYSDNTKEDLYGFEAAKKKGITDIKIKDVILRQDGGILLVSEITKVYERRHSYSSRSYSRGYGSGGRWVDYYYEDLVLQSFHPDGNEHWSQVFHKKQFSQDDDAAYSSFFLFSSPTHIRLIFNDEISNNNTVSEYVIAGNGINDRNSVMSTEYQKLKLRFSKAVQISGNEYVVPSDRNAKLNLVKVVY